MKKIYFDDKFCLTDCVIKGNKTQIRKLVTYPKVYKGIDVAGFYAYRKPSDKKIFDLCLFDEDEIPIDEGQILPKYKIGEIIAVGQNYKDANVNFIPCDLSRKHNRIWGHTCNMRGWENKFYVRPDLMPHQIKIVDVRIECLQDISDEDCLKEGIEFDCKAKGFYCGYNKETNSKIWLGSTPREAFSVLIDKIYGKGTWENNPYCFVYDFEIIK